MEIISSYWKVKDHNICLFEAFTNKCKVALITERYLGSEYTKHNLLCFGYFGSWDHADGFDAVTLLITDIYYYT